MDSKTDSLIDRFNRRYFHGDPPVHHGTPPLAFWLGVRTLKCPLDMWVYQEILWRTRPDVIVECGVYEGGSTLYLASVCDMIGKGRVIGCDIDMAPVGETVRSHPRIKLLDGNSTDPAIVEQVRDLCTGQRTMVILDSEHSETHVTRELEAYAPLVSPGCYLIVEDTCVNGHPLYPSHGPGPYEAVEKFLATNSGWSVDRECERFLVTFNPSGYLLREDT